MVKIGRAVSADKGPAEVDPLVDELGESAQEIRNGRLKKAVLEFLRAFKARDAEALDVSSREVLDACADLANSVG